jgi:hypothetical protein
MVPVEAALAIFKVSFLLKKILEEINKIKGIAINAES